MAWGMGQERIEPGLGSISWRSVRSEEPEEKGYGPYGTYRTGHRGAKKHGPDKWWWGDKIKKTTLTGRPGECRYGRHGAYTSFNSTNQPYCFSTRTILVLAYWVLRPAMGP